MTARPLARRAASPDTRVPTASALWFGFLAAPVAWLAHLSLAAALVPAACHLGAMTIVHLTTLVTAVVALAGIVVALRNRTSDGTSPGYARFLAIGGAWLGVLFLALIILEGLPPFFLEPCG